MTALACPTCGTRNDLDRVRSSGYERVLTCSACGAVDRWEIAHDRLRVPERSALAAADASRPVRPGPSW